MVHETAEPPRGPRVGLRRVLWALAWLVLTVAMVLIVDEPVTQWAEAHRLRSRSPGAYVWRWPGHFSFTIVLAVMLGLWHRLRWRGAVLVLSCGVAGGVVYSVMKWAVGRLRPEHGDSAMVFHPLTNGLSGLIWNKNLSFPSGHATLAFATAFAMGLLLPRFRGLFFVAAAVVGLERIVEGAHYPSDVLGSVAAGWLAVEIIRPLVMRKTSVTAQA